jgi:molecular chaperone DnaK
MKAEAEANANADKAAKERIDKINQADSMIFQTEKQLKELGDKIPADKKAPIESALNNLKEAHKSQDVAAIDKAMEALNNAFHAASEDMYKNAGAGAGQQQANPNMGGQQQQSSGSSSNNSDEVTDVDFEEVK